MGPKTDEIWIARIKYWPTDKNRYVVIKIYYAWKDGRIQFVPVHCEDADPIWATSCHEFELIRKVELE